MAPASGPPAPSQLCPVTVPVSLPHDLGGATCMVTSTVVDGYGVSSAMVSWAVYVPGWPTCAESVVTVTSTVSPGATVSVVGSALSHETSPPPPHWSYPGSISDSGVALKLPTEPPILYMPHAAPPR